MRPAGAHKRAGKPDGSFSTDISDRTAADFKSIFEKNSGAAGQDPALPGKANALQTGNGRFFGSLQLTLRARRRGRPRRGAADP